MKEFINQIEKFLFDIIGIIIPGFIITIFIGWILKNTINIKSDDTLLLFYKDNKTIFIITGLILLYIIGTIVKVLAIMQYTLFSVIFKPIKYTLNKLNNWLKKGLKINLYKYINWFIHYMVSLIIYITNILERIFTFDAPSYSSQFQDLEEVCEEEVRKIFGVNDKLKWYPLYKLCTVAIRENSITSLTERFLAKYNFYRSMAFVFLCIAIYFMFGVSENMHKNLIVFMTWIFWYCFHYKFKRYWVLCGDEAFISALYYIKDKKK